MQSKRLPLWSMTEWNIDIDRYINPYILSQPARRLPPMLGRFLGHRLDQPRPLGNVVIAIWSFIGTLASLSLIYVVTAHIPAIEDRQAPFILGSFVSLSDPPTPRCSCHPPRMTRD